MDHVTNDAVLFNYSIVSLPLDNKKGADLIHVLA